MYKKNSLRLVESIFEGAALLRGEPVGLPADLVHVHDLKVAVGHLGPGNSSASSDIVPH